MNQSWQHFLIYIYFIFYTFNPINELAFFPFISFSKIFSNIFSMFNPYLRSVYLSLLMKSTHLSFCLPFQCVPLSTSIPYHCTPCHICFPQVFDMIHDCRLPQTISSIQEYLSANVYLYYGWLTCAIINKNASICCFQVTFHQWSVLFLSCRIPKFNSIVLIFVFDIFAHKIYAYSWFYVLFELVGDKAGNDGGFSHSSIP